MYQNRRVVVVIPAGRKQYLEILIPQVIAQGECVDEIRLWCNSYNEEDINYINLLRSSTQSEKITVEYNDIIVDRLGWGWSIYPFFKNCIDKNTVYVRLDDDIVWMEAGALENLIKFRLENLSYFLIYANIINNPILSHIHQRIGAMHTRAGLAQYDPLDPMGYESAEFWEATHVNFNERRKAGTLNAYKFGRWELYHQERMQINCISWLGEDFADFNGIVPVDEEKFLTMEYPKAINKINCVFGQALVCHSAFWKQRLKIFEKFGVEDEFNTKTFLSYKNTNLQQKSEYDKLIDGINAINGATIESLRDVEFVEKVICEFGLTPDIREVYGEYSRYQNEQQGLYQIPSQLANAMITLSYKQIQSAIEIGTWYGWTATFMAAYLRRFNPGFRMQTIDNKNLFHAYDEVRNLVPLDYLNTTSDSLKGGKWDLCFIDGDHSFEGVRKDWDNVGNSSKICMFHDINDNFVFKTPGYDGGVVSFWQVLKDSNTSKWQEFTQGEGEWMGIGIAEPLSNTEVQQTDEQVFESYVVDVI